MSESEVVSKVSRRSRSEADRLVLEFERSGMTRTAFCRTHGVSAHTLDYYRRLRRGKVDATARLLPVDLVAGPSHQARLRVELRNGRQIVVEEGFSAALLKSVVAALEA